MLKTIFTKQSQILRETIVDLRNEAKLTQRDLAKRLEREHSFVARIELGERRIDVLEFFWICKACGADPVKTFARLVTELKKLA